MTDFETEKKNYESSSLPEVKLPYLNYKINGTTEYTLRKQDPATGLTLDKIIDAGTGNTVAYEEYPHQDKFDDVEGFFHEASRIEIEISSSGTIEVECRGYGEKGDPLATGYSVHYNPDEKTLTVFTLATVTKEGKMLSPQGESERTYKVKLENGAATEALKSITDSDIDVPIIKPGTPGAEKGIFTDLHGPGGYLEATVYDRGRISQGAIRLQYTDPKTGEIIKMGIDKNTVVINEVSATGAVQSATVKIDIFDKNDFRYQPAAEAKPLIPKN